MLAKKRVEQHLCKGTADRLKKIATEEVIAASLIECLCSRPLSHAHRDGFARTDPSDVPHEGALASMVKKEAVPVFWQDTTRRSALGSRDLL